MLSEKIPAQLKHKDIRRGFTRVVNILQPEHPYEENPYPIENKNVNYGYLKASSSAYASCGPRRGNNKVLFKADKKSFQDSSWEKILQIYTHEMTHITVGSHTSEYHGSHPPSFWREYGFLAHNLMDHWEDIQNTFGPCSKIEFAGHVVDDINPYNLDLRYTSVRNQQHEMAKWFRSHLEA